MQGIPVELQNWTTITSCGNLRHFMSNLSLDPSEVEQYIIRNNDVPMTTPPEQTVQNEVRSTTQEVEVTESIITVVLFPP